MLKNSQYLLLLMIAVLSCGCSTLKGAADGFNEDVKTLSNPEKNGWDTVQDVDDWIKQNLW